jgi:hypothetical protein
MSTPNNITPENCRLLLAAYMNEKKIGAPRISEAIGCSHATLARILAGTSKPTDEFIKQVGILIGIGYERYKKLSDAEKETISEKIGTISGGVVGFGTITAAISASGVVAGLSAAGITSGLAAIGAVVGGGMTAGVAVLAAVPIAVGAAGYGIIKGVKYLFSQHKLNNEAIDPKWEEPWDGENKLPAVV